MSSSRPRKIVISCYSNRCRTTKSLVFQRETGQVVSVVSRRRQGVGRNVHTHIQSIIHTAVTARPRCHQRRSSKTHGQSGVDERACALGAPAPRGLADARRHVTGRAPDRPQLDMATLTTRRTRFKRWLMNCRRTHTALRLRTVSACFARGVRYAVVYTLWLNISTR